MVAEESYGVPPKLAEFRRQLDQIDRELVILLARRFRVTDAVGHYKAENEMPPADPEREKRQRHRMRELAEREGLDPDFVVRIHSTIVDEATENHRRIQRDQQ
ncbi:chorismate mutase [Actinobaculum suis]|uniref:Chorismate mutase n=1 Tax=Actinobaculum suis TaxID=1657 RepID=A0A0K9EVS6_9ACTO|nr:chorismate mutase [Actinobaculum suis]KMY24071.1 hypothetical protein ACU19_00810 [Actinobaculum suis]MDY5153992.1 chorismate mutase [Actinobaculum suis]OCA95683.1 hypothetical protein ACU20_00510 [Actinobaculum suis]OCA95884.1 hypothetical protein ACU21_00505 [Actinobaculum suis]SDE03446.1 chorismate mutase [Actinobaculum suis]